MTEHRYRCFVSHHWASLNKQKQDRTVSNSSSLSGNSDAIADSNTSGCNSNSSEQFCTYSIGRFKKLANYSNSIEFTEDLIRSTNSHHTAHMPSASLFVKETVQNIKKSFLCHWTLFPVVHAQTRDSEEGGETTLDRLARANQGHSTRHVLHQQTEEFLASQTGLDRMRLLYTGVETAYGPIRHPDVSFSLSILQTVMGAMFAMGSAHNIYMIRKQIKQAANAFDIKQAAKHRSMNSKLVNEAFFAGMRWSLYGGIGVILLMGTVLGISSYRNKSGVVEVAIATGLIGAMSAVQQGSKVILQHSLLGLALGSGIGYLMLHERRKMGITQEEQNRMLVQRILETTRQESE